jgi:hypothetical protein
MEAQHSIMPAGSSDQQAIRCGGERMRSELDVRK